MTTLTQSVRGIGIKTAPLQEQDARKNNPLPRIETIHTLHPGQCHQYCQPYFGHPKAQDMAINDIQTSTEPIQIDGQLLNFSNKALFLLFKTI